MGRERKILHNNAPHIVFPERMLMPFTFNGSYGRIMSGIGLSIYDWLAGVAKNERRKLLNKKEAIATEPLLAENELLGAA